MKQLVLGILAHVDAGKTTLSEALLCREKIVMPRARSSACVSKCAFLWSTRPSVRAASRSFRGRRA